MAFSHYFAAGWALPLPREESGGEGSRCCSPESLTGIALQSDLSLWGAVILWHRALVFAPRFQRCALSIRPARRFGSSRTSAPRRFSSNPDRAKLLSSRVTASRRELTRAASSAWVGGGEITECRPPFSAGRARRSNSE